LIPKARPLRYSGTMVCGSIDEDRRELTASATGQELTVYDVGKEHDR
jgi:hypothetical protein